MYHNLYSKCVLQTWAYFEKLHCDLIIMQGGMKLVMNLSSQLGSIEKTWVSESHKHTPASSGIKIYGRTCLR